MRIDRGRVKKLSEEGFTLREIASRLGVSHGAIALIRKELKMKTKLVVLALALAFTACATPQYAWRPAPEKDVAQTQADIVKCQRASYLVPNGKWGHGQADFFNNCMYSFGHKLVEQKE